MSAGHVNGIGELFQISPGDVLVLVERLQSDGLLSIHWGGQVSFTTKGRDLASGTGMRAATAGAPGSVTIGNIAQNATFVINSPESVAGY